MKNTWATDPRFKDCKTLGDVEEVLEQEALQRARDFHAANPDFFPDTTQQAGEKK